METIYCLKCREKKEVKDFEIITTKNNRRAITAKCPTCGCKMFKFLPKEKTSVEAPIETPKETPSETPSENTIEKEIKDFDEAGQ